MGFISKANRDSGARNCGQIGPFDRTLPLPSDRVESAMPKTTRSANNNRAYRQRLRAAGSEGVLLHLPQQTVAMLDAIKERQGLRNRSQALLQLIEQKGAAAQQTT